MMNIDKSDLYKILDALKINSEYHANRDRMNAALHQAAEVRNSPLTTTTVNAYERLRKLLDEDYPTDTETLDSDSILVTKVTYSDKKDKYETGFRFHLADGRVVKTNSTDVIADSVEGVQSSQ